MINLKGTFRDSRSSIEWGRTKVRSGKNLRNWTTLNKGGEKERRCLKEGNISRDEITLMIRRVTPIAFLKL